MKRNRRWFRIWLTPAFGVVSLAFAASASAMMTGPGPGNSTVPSQPPVVAHPGGFDWGIAAIGAAVVLVAFAAFAFAVLTHNRGRLATSV